MLFSPLNISGQEEPDTIENKPGTSPWSVSVSYSPHITFSFDPSATYQSYKVFLSGFNVTVEGISFSKIKGAKGNVEFWLYLKKQNDEIGNKNLLIVKKTENNYVKIITETVDKSVKYFD